MEHDIKQLSKRIPIAVDGLTQMIATGGQLGVPREKLAQFAEIASKMSIAFDITADEASQSMAKLSNVLQVPIEEMTKVGDVINHLSNNTAATAQDLLTVSIKAGAMSIWFMKTCLNYIRTLNFCVKLNPWHSIWFLVKKVKK